MKRLLIIIISSLYAVSLYAQGELNEQQKIFFRNERSYALMLNTDGFGAGFRGAKRIDFLNKRLIEIDAGILKSIKEYRQRIGYQGGSFVFGKINSTFYVRGGIGHQREIYKKADLGGIAIRYFYSAGPVFAVYKPIYYKVLYPKPLYPGEFIWKEQKFDVTTIAAPQDVYGKAPFTKGLKETRFLPGLYAKAGFNFEYSKEDKAIHAIEIGIVINAFSKEVPIMAVDNKQIFASLFLSYRFGIIVDPLHPEYNRMGNVFRRKRAE